MGKSPLGGRRATSRRRVLSRYPGRISGRFPPRAGSGFRKPRRYRRPAPKFRDRFRATQRTREIPPNNWRNSPESDFGISAASRAGAGPATSRRRVSPRRGRPRHGEFRRRMGSEIRRAGRASACQGLGGALPTRRPIRVGQLVRDFPDRGGISGPWEFWPLDSGDAL